MAMKIAAQNAWEVIVPRQLPEDGSFRGRIVRDLEMPRWCPHRHRTARAAARCADAMARKRNREDGIV